LVETTYLAGVQVDMAAEELRVAAHSLGVVTGKFDVEDLLDIVFRDFCIGK
jgi:tRNA modification GTPase